MAIDPAVQFQQAGLNVPYQYTPVTTHLNPPIQLPGTGELWAQVGRTAMGAADMLQKSALNPEVRAQMAYGVDQYKRAQEQIAAMRKLGPMGLMLGQTGPEGYSQAAPATISDPTMAARLMEAMKLGPSQGKGGGPPPKVNEPTGKEGSETPPAAEKEKTPTPPTTQEMGKPQTSAAPTTSNLAASTDNDFLLRRMMEEHQAAGLGEPAPPDQLAAPPLTSAPNMFAGPAAAPPPAPSQPASATQPTTPGTVPGSLSDQYAKQQLAQWQTQNAHPVMASGDALNWAKNFDTGAQRATYLPHGGPQGEPAYAFHMKGGGVNTVPISQIVKNGGGAAVAGQNTSAALSTSDALTNQPPGQVPGMTLGATGQAPPGIALGQQPPAAPSQPYQPTDYRTAAEQGQPPGAYAGAPYQQAVAQAAAIPQNLMAQTAPAGQPAQPTQPGQPLHPLADATLTAGDIAAVQTQATRMPPASGKYTGDPVVRDTTGPYTYYRNDDPNSPSRGRVYTILPGPAGGYFNQQRWYLGTNQYETYELPDSAMRQTMWDKWGTNGYLTRDEISKMKPEEMKPWLQRAWQNENFTRSSPTQGLNSDLDASEQLHNYLKKIGDLEQTLAANGYPNLNSDNKIVAAAKNASVSLGQRHLSEIAGVDRMDAVSAAAIKMLDQTINQAQGFLKDHPQLLLTPGEGGGQPVPSIQFFGTNIPTPNIPGSNVLSDSAFSGRNIADRSQLVNGLLKLTDNRYRDLIDQAQTQWMRISDKHDANMIKLGQGREFNDPTNSYQQHIHTINTKDDYMEFAKNHPDTPFLGPDGKKRWTPHNPPSE